MKESFDNIENFDFSLYEHLPFPILITQDWKIIYYNSLVQNLFEIDIQGKELTEFLSKEQQNFLKFHLNAISENQILTISTFFTVESKTLNFLLHIKTLKDKFQKCYFFIAIQEINQVSEKFNILSKIVLETFTIYGEKLYKELLDKITKYYSLDGAALLVYNQKDQTQKLLYSSFHLGNVLFPLGEKLLRKIQNFRSILVSKDFKKYYPDELLAKSGIESLIALKAQATDIEDLILVTFSSKEILEPRELHFELSILSVKIISEYLRLNQNLKFKRIYKTFIDTNDAIVIYHIDSDSIIDYNPAFCKLLGYSEEEIKNKSIFDLPNFPISQKHKKTFFYYYHKNRLKNLKFRFKIKNKTGFEIPVEVALNFIKEDDSTIMFCLIRDLTFATQAIEEHKKYIQTLSLLNLQVIELNENLEILFANNLQNSKFKKITRGMNFLEIVLPDFRDYVKTVLENLLKKGKNIRIRFPIRIYGTRNDWIEGDFILLKKRHNKLIRGILKDITLEYLTEKQFLLLAENDLLTSLPNRNRLEEDLFKAILRADKNHTLLAVGFLDLDKFYNVNEFLGHRIGDLVLSLFAERLRLLPEINYSTYRWGGDQFVFIIENIKSKSELIPFTEKLKQLAKEPFLLEGEKFFLTFSVGIALYPINATTIDTLFGEADKAMNYAKYSGRFQIIFADNLPKKSFPLSKLEIQSYILQSISEKKINIFYQPIYDTLNKKIIGIEALARLNRFRNNVYIGPDIFIPMAEDLGLIEELSYHIIYKAFEFQKKILNNFELYLSINISRRLLYSDYFLMNLFDIQNHVGISPTRVALEITESLAMLEKETAFKKIRHLKEMGYKIAIDDFGTGYSSLGFLQEFPIDIIKIDKIFIKKLEKEENNRILEAIVHIANALNVSIVAEGVEYYSTVELLNKMGIYNIQGFFFAPPLSAADLEKKLYEGFSQKLSYLI